MNFAVGQKRIRRPYENTALVAVRQERAVNLFWTRRGRKSTTLGSIALAELSAGPGRTVIAASASLLLGSELVNMTATAAEQAILVRQEAAAQQAVFAGHAAAAELQFVCARAGDDRVYPELAAEDFADLYVSKRLEMRLYFDRTSYSRQLVIAPNPATARGWGGTVLRDEAGFTRPETELELQLAVNPIFRTDPSFKMIKASNLSPDDRHPWFEETLPPAGAEFPPDPAGHFYRGRHNVLIHRVALADAYAAGHVLYDNHGRPLTYEEFCADPANRLELPGNYQLQHVLGGTAVIDLAALLTAQTRGTGEGVFVFVHTAADFDRALAQLRELLTDGPVGIGCDPATTTDDTSNPTAVTVTEQQGDRRIARLILCWKERREQVQRERLRRIVETVRERPMGGPARRLCLDASNERLFAQGTQEALRELIPVQLIVSGARVEPPPPGQEASVNHKSYLGELYSAAINDNRYSLPPDLYVKEDHRLVLKSGGRFTCTPDRRDGRHGDTFDAGKLAEYALRSVPGAVQSVVTGRPAATAHSLQRRIPV